MLLNLCKRVSVLVFIAASLAFIAFGPAAAEMSEAHTVEFIAQSDENVIAGEVIQAAGSSPDMVLIVIGGSGATTREATRPAAQLFLTETTAVAVLDRRGHGQSTGRYEQPGTKNSSWLIPAIGADIADVAKHLRALGFNRIGVVGSSMGGWIAASAAAQAYEIDFLVGFAGGAVPVAVSDAFNVLTERDGLTIKEATERARDVDTSVGYNPAADLKDITQPGLWIFGALDQSNPTFLEIETLDRLIAEGKNFQYILLEGANHEFVDVETGAFNASWLGPFQKFVEDRR